MNYVMIIIQIIDFLEIKKYDFPACFQCLCRITYYRRIVILVCILFTSMTKWFVLSPVHWWRLLNQPKLSQCFCYSENMFVIYIQFCPVKMFFALSVTATAQDFYNGGKHHGRNLEIQTRRFLIVSNCYLVVFWAVVPLNKIMHTVGQLLVLFCSVKQSDNVENEWKFETMWHDMFLK